MAAGEIDIYESVEFHRVGSSAHVIRTRHIGRTSVRFPPEQVSMRLLKEMEMLGYEPTEWKNAPEFGEWVKQNG